MDTLDQMLSEALSIKKRDGKIEAYKDMIQFCRDQIAKLKISEINDDLKMTKETNDGSAKVHK